MDKSVRLHVLSTLIEHIADGTTADAGGIMRAPMSDFTCPKLLAREQDVFFETRLYAWALRPIFPSPIHTGRTARRVLRY